jgi:hypothetical protein
MTRHRIPSPTRLAAAAGLALLAAALGGCQTDVTGTPGPVAQTAPPPPAAQAAAPEAISRHQAATECWMAVEKGRKDLPLDRRADIVTQCVAKKLKAAQAPAPQAPPTRPAAQMSTHAPKPAPRSKT